MLLTRSGRCGVALAGLVALALAGETGKIAGRAVGDAGQPPLQANVVITGQTLGETSDVNGYSVMLNIPVGTYVIEASMTGQRGNDERRM